MCLYPRIIKNRKYISNKKNKGVIPAMKDKRTEYVPVGCGNCIECRKQKAREWQVRLHEEIRQRNDAKFVTLTFNEDSLIELENLIGTLEGYDLANEVATLAVRRFLERWRKKHKKSVRHWLITELGHNGTERIHIHGLIWTDKVSDISKIWGYGFVSIGKQRWSDGNLIWDGENYVNERTINYIVKYVTKVDEQHKGFKSKILTSNGIGSGYFNRIDHKNNVYKGKDTKEYYKTRQGTKLALPIYYRNKLFGEEERENLWLSKLDKQERWVLGNRIDISESDEDYYNALKSAREKNQRLGYGKLEGRNWDRLKYENERKDLI